MHGNVWEWCEDVWHGNYNGSPVDGSAWMSGGDSNKHLLRVGSWCYFDGYLRCAGRSGFDTSNWYGSGGLRFSRVNL